MQPLPSTSTTFARQRGTALLWVGMVLVVFAGVLLAGVKTMRAQDAGSDVGYAVDGHAYAAARAGLADALAWMRRNPTQPVLSFEPRLDMDGEVAIDETEDPSIGLVRTYEVTPGLWARYEVRRGRPMDPFNDANGNGLYDEGEVFADLPDPDPPEEGEAEPSPPPMAYLIEAAGLAQQLATELMALSQQFPDPQSAEFLSAFAALSSTFEAAFHALAVEYGVIVAQAQTPDQPAVSIPEIDDGYGDGAWTPSLWSREISEERGLPGTGSVWRIEARGMVFRMVDETKPLGVDPNRRLAQTWLATEVRRLTVSPPASAAICVPSAGDVYIGVRARLRADALAVAARSVDAGVVTSTGSTVDAPTLAAEVPDYKDDVNSIFGVDWPELRSMADVSTDGTKARLAGAVDPYTLVTIEGDIAFGPEAPLRGKGVVAVHGNMLIQEGSASFFNGVLYVNGNLTIRGPALVRGLVICTGRVVLEGSDGDFVDVEHDAGTLGDLLAYMGQYRVARAVYTPDAELLDARNVFAVDALLYPTLDYANPTVPSKDLWANALEVEPIALQVGGVKVAVLDDGTVWYDEYKPVEVDDPYDFDEDPVDADAWRADWWQDDDSTDDDDSSD